MCVCVWVSDYERFVPDRDLSAPIELREQTHPTSAATLMASLVVLASKPLGQSAAAAVSTDKDGRACERKRAPLDAPAHKSHVCS